jgi:hypothetical protein
MEEVAEGCKEVRNEEHRNVHSSSDSIRTIKSRRIRWARHAAHLRDLRSTYELLSENVKGEASLEDLGVDDWI